MSARKTNRTTETVNLPEIVNTYVNGHRVIDLLRTDVIYAFDGYRPCAVDLAAKVFQVCYQDDNGHLVNKAMSLAKFKKFVSESKGDRLYIMEGCSSSSSWATLMMKFGDKVKLVNPDTTHRKIFSSGIFKDDRNDAHHLRQASFFTDLRYCRIRTEDELCLKSMFRVRQQTKKQLDAAFKETFALLFELRDYGSIWNERDAVEAIYSYCNFHPTEVVNELASKEAPANPYAVFTMKLLAEKIKHCQGILDEINMQAERYVQFNPYAQKLMTIPGMGPLSAAALMIAIGDINNFESARQLRAFLGVVTSHKGSGGKIINGKLSTAGDKALKGFLYEAAQAVMKACQRYQKKAATEEDLPSVWLYLNSIKKTTGYKKRVIRVMAKMVSVCFGVLHSGKNYDATINNCLGNPKSRVKTKMARNLRTDEDIVKGIKKKADKKAKAKAKAAAKAKAKAAEQAPAIQTIPVSDVAAAGLGL